MDTGPITKTRRTKSNWEVTLSSKVTLTRSRPWGDLEGGGDSREKVKAGTGRGSESKYEEAEGPGEARNCERTCHVSKAVGRSPGNSFKEEKKRFEVFPLLSKNHFSHFEKLTQNSICEKRYEFFISTEDCMCPSWTKVWQVEKTPVSRTRYFVWEKTRSTFYQIQGLPKQMRQRTGKIPLSYNRDGSQTGASPRVSKQVADGRQGGNSWAPEDSEHTKPQNNPRSPGPVLSMPCPLGHTPTNHGPFL